MEDYDYDEHPAGWMAFRGFRATDTHMVIEGVDDHEIRVVPFAVGAAQNIGCYAAGSERACNVALPVAILHPELLDGMPEPQARVAHRLALAHGHEWAREVSELDAVASSLLQLMCRSYDSGNELPGIQRPTLEDGLVVHTTRSGRLSWTIERDGRARIEIHRPAPADWYSDACLAVDIKMGADDAEIGDAPAFCVLSAKLERGRHRKLGYEYLAVDVGRSTPMYAMQPFGTRHLEALKHALISLEPHRLTVVEPRDPRAHLGVPTTTEAAALLDPLWAAAEDMDALERTMITVATVAPADLGWELRSNWAE